MKLKFTRKMTIINCRFFIAASIIGFIFVLMGGQTLGQDSRQKEISIEQRIIFPAAGCDNGEAISNLALPTQGGAKPECVGRGQSSFFPYDNLGSTSNRTVEIGTVIVVGVSREQVIVAADSRSGIFDLTTKKFKRVDDRRCKLVRLTPSLLFAAAGQTKTGSAIPTNIYYDSQKLARNAVRNFVFDHNWMKPNETVIEIATKWAWDVAFRIRRGVKSGVYEPPNARTWVIGVFAGLEPNGEVSVAVATLDYDQPRPGMIVPTVSISVSVPVPPKDFTWIEAIGHNEIAEKYLSSRRRTAETEEEYQRIRADQLRNPSEFHPKVIQRLIELTREKEAHEYPDGSKKVGGKIDIARLSRSGRVEWIQRKQSCSNTKR